MLPGCKQTTPAHTMRKYVLPKVNCRDVALALSQSELTKGLGNQGIAGWNGISGNMATWNTRYPPDKALSSG